MTKYEDEELWETLGLGAGLRPQGPLPADAIRAQEVQDAFFELGEAVKDGIVKSGSQVTFSEHIAASFSTAGNDAALAYEKEIEKLTSLEEGAQKQEKELLETANDVRALAQRLDGMAHEVKRLRERTENISNRLSVHKETEVCLAAFVDSMLLSPALIRHLVDGEVGDERYKQCLKELQRKIAQYDLADAKRAASYADLKSVLDKVVTKAVYKVKRFLLQNIELLRVPNTNIHIIKETTLLKHRSLMEFLQDTSPQSFARIRDTYADVMSQLYEELFRKYCKGLISLKAQSTSGSITTAEALQSNHSNVTPWGGSQSIRTSTGGHLGSHSLEVRLKSLKKPDAPAVVLPVAESKGQRFCFEEIHRSIGKMLTDTCTTEHRFCAHFFGDTQGRMFTVFFKRVVDILLEIVTKHVASSKDAVGALLALKITETQRLAMQKRNISVLSDYFIHLDVLFKPHFKALFDENVDSLIAAKKNVRSIYRGENDTRPYTITRRFSQFSSSILVLSNFGAADKTVIQSTRRLRIAFNDLLSNVSNLFTKARSRRIFLINNLDLVLGTYGSQNLQSTEDYSYFSSLVTAHVAAYVELELSAHFPDLQNLLRNNKGQKMSVLEPSKKRVKAILQEFGRNWHVAVSHMKEGILRSFPNFVLGDEVLGAVLAALLTLHRRTEAFVNSRYESLGSELVDDSSLAEKIASVRRAGPSLPTRSV